MNIITSKHNSNTAKNIALYIFFLALLALMMTWTSQTSSPPMPLRILYMMSIFLVPLFLNSVFLIPAFTCLLTVSVYGFSHSYLPYDYPYYVGAFFACLFFLKKENKDKTYNQPKLILFAFFVFLVDFLNSFFISNLFYCLLIVLFFSLLVTPASIKDNQDEIIKLFAIFYSFAALALAFFYFRFGRQFTVNYDVTSGLERVVWQDPNYLSTTIGMSVMSSFIVLLLGIKTNLIEKILFFLTSGLGIAVMVLCASRGGIVALGMGSVFLLLFSNVKKTNKIVAIFFIVVFIIYLLNNNYFELLEYRFASDEGGGSGRSYIWLNKLNLWLESGNPFYFLFGMGSFKGLELGGRVCFHNDFVAYLVCYGVVGLFFFIFFLLRPLFKTSRHSSFRPAVIAALIYLATCSMTLNPLSEGHLNYFCFYFFINILCEENPTKRSGYEKI